MSVREKFEAAVHETSKCPLKDINVSVIWLRSCPSLLAAFLNWTLQTSAVAWISKLKYSFFQTGKIYSVNVVKSITLT
jgi:hypothetical protein